MKLVIFICSLMLIACVDVEGYEFAVANSECSTHSGISMIHIGMAGTWLTCMDGHSKEIKRDFGSRV